MAASSSRGRNVMPAAFLPQAANYSIETESFSLDELKRILIEPESHELRTHAFYLGKELSARLKRFIHVGVLEPATDPLQCIGLSMLTRKMFLGTEGYDLDVKKEVAFISAPSEVGIIRGIHSFLGLVDIALAGDRQITTCRALDKPWLPWRAVFLDASYSTPPIEWLRRFVDALARLRVRTLRLALPVGDPPAYDPHDLKGLLSYGLTRHVDISAEPGGVSIDEDPTFMRLVRTVRDTADGADSTAMRVEQLGPEPNMLIPSVDWIYSLDPKVGLDEDSGQQIAGLELWIRMVPGIPLQLWEQSVMTRLAAFAELAWTPFPMRNFMDFRNRLGSYFQSLDRLNFDYDVPPPAGMPDRIEFEEKAAFELVPPFPGASVVYTIDGADPGPQSPVADKPLFIERTCVVKAQTRAMSGKYSAVVATHFEKLPS